VSPLLRLCSAPGCTATIEQPRKHCPTHARLDSARRNTRTRRDGRNTNEWLRLRARVLAHADHQCQLREPGCTHVATTVHKQDGGYHYPIPEDYLAACAHCHGVTDGGRGRLDHPDSTPQTPLSPSPVRKLVF
jgi:hypothetical protein